MSNFQESEHPRNPRGQFQDKPGTNQTSAVSLSENPLSVNDLEFQQLRCVYPLLEGATIEYADGQQGKIETWIDDEGRTRAKVDSLHSRGDLPGQAYRITEYDGDPERLQHELEYLSAIQDYEQARSDMYEKQETIADMTGAEDVHFYDDLDGESYMNIPVGDSGAEFECWLDGENFVAEFSEGSGDYPKSKYNKAKKAVDSDQFPTAMAEFLSAHTNAEDVEADLNFRYNDIVSRYGERMHP